MAALSVLALLGMAVPGHARPVEPQHPVYELIRRLELKGLIPAGVGGPAGIRPWDSREVAAALDAAAAASAARPGALRAWERRELDIQLQEFDPERRRESTRLKVVDSTYSLFAGVDFWGAGYAQDSLPEGVGFLTGSFGPRMDATFWSDAYLLTSGFIGMERSTVDRFTETYNPADGLPYNTSREGKQGIPQGVSTFDGFRTVVGYGRGPVRIEAGQDWNAWGPGNWQRMTLGTTGYVWAQDSLPASPEAEYPGTPFPGRHRRGYSRPGEGAPMPQLRLRLQGGKFSYVKVVAERDGIVPDHLATLVAHRLEWRPFPFLVLGGSEMASIGGRVPGPIYWLPLVPLKFLEHQVRDKDNLALSVDVEARRAGWGRVYGELYLDDFSGPPFDFWGNKFAFLAGCEWVEPMGLPAALRVEAAHVDPWVYTHHLTDRQHQHAGALYGSALAANSRALWTQLEAYLRQDLSASLNYRFQQRDFLSRGSSVFDVHEPGVDSDTKAFLDDMPETRHRLDADVTWSWRRYVRFKAGAGLLAVDAWKGTGEDLFGPILLGELSFRY